MIHLDTSFLVDLLRETGKKGKGAASTFLEGAMGEELGISVHVACELFAGAELADRPTEERRRVEKPAYGRLLDWQKKHGGRISTMDLLIATSAVVAGVPFVTRNAKDFSRVPGLDVLSY